MIQWLQLKHVVSIKIRQTLHTFEKFSEEERVLIGRTKTKFITSMILGQEHKF
jgi:hypothetical protein